MAWIIEYYSSDVEAAVLDLPKGLLARYLHLMDLMVNFGSNLGMPHTRSLGEGLSELRIRGQEGIARVFYCTKVGKKIIMLNLFIKKSQKTPKKEIEIARKRMKEVSDRDTR